LDFSSLIFNIEWVNKLLSKEVSEVTEWQRTYEIVSSAPGIGDGVAFTLLDECLN
jgi:transposase